MARIAFFIGKGGVGKTTVSAAYACQIAQRYPRQRVLLVSTDPAHSLGDVFGIEKQSQLAKPHRIKDARGQLFVWQIPAQQQFDQFMRQYRQPILALLEQGTIFSRREIEPLLSTAMPGMAEFAALLALAEALEAESYDHIVVDTAPLGHTLRLFEMPEHFRRFLDFLDLAGSRDQVLAEHFGGGKKISHIFLQEWEQKLEVVRAALTGSDDEEQLTLVTTAEKFSLNEALRAKQALQNGLMPMEIHRVVLNRTIGNRLPTAQKRCDYCKQRTLQTREAVRFLDKNFRAAQVFFAEDSGAPIIGARTLAQFGKHVFLGKPLPSPLLPQTSARKLKLERVEWPELNAPLTMTLGKGGVGKTTISAGLAFHHREQNPNFMVTICSTDPAPSLDDIFQQPVENHPAPVLRDRKLLAAELDGVSEFRIWASRLRGHIEDAFSRESRGGVHVDLSFERRLLSALLDVVPPGVDELFAVFRIPDLLEELPERPARVVIDMAPTGHALELLRMPERMLVWSRLLLKALAKHRSLPLAQNVAVEVAQVEQNVRTLAQKLKQGETQLTVVMLAEPLPDRETGRLLRELAEMKIPAAQIFINRVLLEERLACPRCRLAQQWQRVTLMQLPAKLGTQVNIYIVRNFTRELAGSSGLQSLTRELWQPIKNRESENPRRLLATRSAKPRKTNKRR